VHYYCYIIVIIININISAIIFKISLLFTISQIC